MVLVAIFQKVLKIITKLSMGLLLKLGLNSFRCESRFSIRETASRRNKPLFLPAGKVWRLEALS